MVWTGQPTTGEAIQDPGWKELRTEILVYCHTYHRVYVSTYIRMHC